MPYNPGVSNQSGQLLAQGIERGKSNAMQMVMWLLDRNAKTKEMKGFVKTAFPDVDTSKMGLEDMAGVVRGKFTAEQAKSTALAQQLQQAQLDQFGQQEEQRSAMGEAMREARPPLRTEMMTPAGLPPGGSPFGVRVPLQGPPEASALVGAVMGHPGAEETATGRTVIGDWMRGQEAMKMRGLPEAFNAGGVPGVANPYTGAFQIDPAYTAKARAPLTMDRNPMPKIPDGGWMEPATSGRPGGKRETVPNLFDVFDANGKKVGQWQNVHSGGGRSGGIDWFGTEPPAAPATKNFTAGDTVKQGGTTYRFDGQSWQPIQ